jgi:hypothetical protein
VDGIGGSWDENSPISSKLQMRKENVKVAIELSCHALRTDFYAYPTANGINPGKHSTSPPDRPSLSKDSL